MARSNGKITKVLRLPSNRDDYSAISSEWFPEYLSKALGELHNSYLEKIGEEREVVML